MQVRDSIGSPSKTVSVIDLELGDIPSDIADQIKAEVGQYLVEQVLMTVSAGQTPVADEAWPALSPNYKKLKTSEGGTDIADMELTGAMLNDLSFAPTDDGIELGFIDTDQAWKADGHLKFSGEQNNTPQRRFLPGEGESFKSAIESGVDKIVQDGLSQLFKQEDFQGVETKSELYATLKEELGTDLTREELRLAVYRNSDLYDMLDELDLLDLL